MRLNKEDLDRISAKLDAAPPYDWDDDVAGLIIMARQVDALASERERMEGQVHTLTDAMQRIQAAINGDYPDTFNRILTIIHQARSETQDYL